MSSEAILLASPKQPRRAPTDSSSWYSYYAGYSPAFVNDVLRAGALEPGALVVDPWNGGGTTTHVAVEAGYSAAGFDLNPAMVVVAKARLLGAAIDPSQSVLAAHLLKVLREPDKAVPPDDPLLTWFYPESTASLRRIERSIQRVLLDEGQYLPIIDRGLGKLSGLAAFYYVALFRTVRELLKPFRGSNPTWIREPRSPNARLRPRRTTINDCFRAQVEVMSSVLPRQGAERVNGDLACRLEVADARRLPLANASASAVIGSPPYCTRIDYAVATRPELAVLGYGKAELKELRNQLIGTATVKAVAPPIDHRWGRTCVAFLSSVSAHPSRASSTYYLKNHIQYYSGLYDSLKEVTRVLRPGGSCVLVVQDSYYKEVHNDLPAITVEMAAGLGLALRQRANFATNHPLAALHMHARNYRSDFRATESVLWLERGGE